MSPPGGSVAAARQVIQAQWGRGIVTEFGPRVKKACFETKAGLIQISRAWPGLVSEHSSDVESIHDQVLQVDSLIDIG